MLVYIHSEFIEEKDKKLVVKDSNIPIGNLLLNSIDYDSIRNYCDDHNLNTDQCLNLLSNLAHCLGVSEWLVKSANVADK